MICQNCRDAAHGKCVDVVSAIRAPGARLYRSCFCQHRLDVATVAEPATGPAEE